jgi:chorismate synthase
MGRLSFQVAGESHGPALSLVLTGLPAGLKIPHERIEHWLHLRRHVAGRGPRAPRESDKWTITAGLTDGVASGAPLHVTIENLDQTGQSVDRQGRRANLEFPRPGHGDLAGALKWGLDDATPVAELASARITAAYTVLGAICQEILAAEGVLSLAHVTRIGTISDRRRSWRKGARLERLIEKLEASPLLFLDGKKEAQATELLTEVEESGDTVGGAFEVVVAPIPAGLGSPQPLATRLDSRLAATVMGIPGVRAVAIGEAFGADHLQGREFHSPLHFTPAKGYYHRRNTAGGVEGGMTNGEPVVLRAIVKPLASLGDPLESASLKNGEAGLAPAVRSDVCAAAPAAVVARGLVAFVLADAYLEHLEGEDIESIRSN